MKIKSKIIQVLTNEKNEKGEYFYYSLDSLRNLTSQYCSEQYFIKAIRVIENEVPTKVLLSIDRNNHVLYKFFSFNDPSSSISELDFSFHYLFEQDYGVKNLITKLQNLLCGKDAHFGKIKNITWSKSGIITFVGNSKKQFRSMELEECKNLILYNISPEKDWGSDTNVKIRNIFKDKTRAFGNL